MDGLRARGAGFPSFGEEDAEKPMMTISAVVPLSQMFGYAAELSARSSFPKRCRETHKTDAQITGLHRRSI